jgi:[2Fe-2S] binding domain
MLVVETIAKIRRAYFSLGKPIKEICRELHLSRKVVRKVIRSNATEFHYERSRQPLPRIGPWRQRLESLLEENESKAARERLTLVRLYEELRGLGFEGSYAAVRRYAIAWREKRVSATADAFVPLTFAPGEAYQFDWSHEIVVMDGVTTIVSAFALLDANPDPSEADIREALRFDLCRCGAHVGIIAAVRLAAALARA